MNKKLFLTPLVAVALAATFTACDEEAWNDHLDGYEETDKNPTNVQTINYTLTDADYSTVLSANSSGASEQDLAVLKQIAAKKCFPDAEAVRKYLPAFLNNSSFPYFTLSDKSAVKVTYKIAEALPAELSAAAAAQLYTLSEEDYMDVWESQEDYVPCFAPSHPASKYLARLLGDNADGDSDYCVLSYETSAQEPVFGNVGGGDEPESWAPTSVITSLKEGDQAEVSGVITGICGQGFTLTDNSGTLLVYIGSSFDAASYTLGQQVNVSGVVGAYNTGMQINGRDNPYTIDVVGQQEVTYPKAKAVDGAGLTALGSRTGLFPSELITIKAKVTVSGNYYNFVVDGATPQGSLYQGTASQKAAFSDGQVAEITGWVINTSSRFVNMLVVSVNGKACAPKRRAAHKAPAVEVPTTTERALFHRANGSWSEVSNFVVLTPNDYKALGQQYQNLTNANTLLPKFLAQKFPYAAADDVKNVMYLYYNSSDKTTYYVADQYTFNGSEWILNNGVVEATDQFVRNKGVWNWDPSVVITLPGGKGQAISATYYQACVDWVYENICVPLGDTSIKSGKFYVSSYGNNEYYSGTSAYQGNVDLRPSAAKTQYPAEYGSMTDEQVVALEKKRFMEEVMPGALAKLHPDAVPVEGIDVTYTINFVVYDGSNSNHTAVFRVVGPAKFEPVSCTWDDKE